MTQGLQAGNLDFWIVALTGKSLRISQNAVIERFNRTYRHEVLDVYLLSSFEQVREITEEWVKDDNEDQRLRVNGKLPPVENWQHPKQTEMFLIGLST